MRQVTITRYVTPLREGSSLPALVEADDGAEYVINVRPPHVRWIEQIAPESWFTLGLADGSDNGEHEACAGAALALPGGRLIEQTPRDHGFARDSFDRSNNRCLPVNRSHRP